MRNHCGRQKQKINVQSLKNQPHVMSTFKIIWSFRLDIPQVSQYRANLRQIWSAVDSNRSVLPRNILKDQDLIEDYFYKPLYPTLQENLKLSKEQKSPHIQQSTRKSKLYLLSVTCTFLINRGLFINLTIEYIQRLTMKVQEISQSSKKSIDAQESVSRIKSETLNTVINFQNY